MEPLDGYPALGRRARAGAVRQPVPDGRPQTIAKVLGLPPEQVQIETMLAGGSFGRRAQPTIASRGRAGRGRQGDRPEPAGEAGLDARGRHPRRLLPAAVRASHARRASRDGKIVAWANTIVGQSILKGTPFEAMIKDGIDRPSVEGASELPYEIAEFPLRPAHDRGRRAGAVVALGRAHPYRLRGRVLRRRAAAGGRARIRSRAGSR